MILIPAGAPLDGLATDYMKIGLPNLLTWPQGRPAPLSLDCFRSPIAQAGMLEDWKGFAA